jgi:CHAT domain-containing protein/tetratricopeptide (TPR) repeat protein
METFQSVFSLNQRLGATTNLARNKRAIAYNTYRQAEKLSGQNRRDTLKAAEKAFTETLMLIDTHGVPEKSSEPKKGLISISTQVSLEAFESTQAAYGFSAEQEKRIAETFLSRIHLELDELLPAEEAMVKQLIQYPPNQPVSDKDIFGVSLLYHRAGHLAAARNKYSEAFDYFRHSADLAFKMKNAVSTAINVANMARLVGKVSQEAAEQRKYFIQLALADRKASHLLERFPPATREPVAARFHNTLGIYYLSKKERKTDKLGKDARYMRKLQSAGVHFAKGIQLLEKQLNRRDRKMLALLATLHLNLARVGQAVGEAGQAAAHFKKALEYSLNGLLPDLQWRAHVGLNNYKEAIETLETVTISRAGCEQEEITSAFGPMVLSLVRENKIEEAFNLAERLSELERFHRMAPFWAGISDSEKNLYRDLYPRFKRIHSLRKELASAKGEQKQYLTETLAREEKLVQSAIGKSGESLSESIQNISDNRNREQVMMLFGIAAAAETQADDTVWGIDRNSSQIETYQNLISDYRSLREDAKIGRPENIPADIVTFFGPEPIEAIDVMEYLPQNGALVRLFKTESDTIVFTVTPDEISGTIIKSLDDLSIPGVEAAYIATENPIALPPSYLNAIVLSGTHFVRSVVWRKPFKRSLLSIPPPEESLNVSSDTNKLDVLLPHTDKEIFQALPSIHTLLISSPIHRTATVPTRAAERPLPFFGIERDRGPRLRLEPLLFSAQNMSLLALPNASIEDAYLLGHLASISGVPGVLLPHRLPMEHVADPVREPAGDLIDNTGFIEKFLMAYPSNSTLGAMREAQIASENARHWMLLGFQGMTPEESGQFLEKHFSQYVKRGQAAFKNKEYKRALGLFENAIQIALEQETYRKYLLTLYQYGREGAYQSGNLQKALIFAKNFADGVSQKMPDSKEHADALLRLGLIYARLEQFEQAIPILEEAAEIMEVLELEEEYIVALSDLGVVLESATDYDRALTRFQSAASLSKKLNKDEFLADQYRSIGRIYDLRLSQYALAMENYKKAYQLYGKKGKRQKTAQALIDIGRCYRLLGDFEAAEKHYQKASTDMDGDDNEMKAKIVIEQANNAWFQARYQEAFTLQRTAYRIANDEDLPLMQIISLNTAGLIWWTLGDSEKAHRELDNALQNARSFKKRQDEVATTLNNIGLVYREMGKYQEALQAFNEALAIDTKLRSRWAIAYDLRNKALTLLRMGRPADAIPLFKKAVAEAGSIGNRINEAKAYLAMGDAYLSQGNLADAAAAFEPALTLSKTMAIRETEWRALYGLASVKLSDDQTEAQRLLYEAVEIIESIRSEIKIEQLRDSFIINKLSVYETLVSLLVNRGKFTEAFEVAERSRARNFIDLLGNQRLALSNSIDQRLLEQHKRLASRIETQTMLLAQAKKEEERIEYGKALENLQNEYQNLMLEIQAKNPQLSSLITVQPLDTDKLVHLLEPQLALLTYYVLDKEVYCWVVKTSGMKLFRIPVGRDALGQTILEFRRRIQNLEPLEDQSRNLYDWLISPLVNELEGIETLGIIPHGPLHYLSFMTLMDQESYVVDRYSLFYLPSASVIEFTLKRRLPKKNFDVLAIGNPDLKDPAFDLPFAEHEVRSIKWNFPNITLLTREEATESWVVNNINKFGIIHLASHGEFDPINPLFSSIKLAKSPEADGNLQAAEIFGLTLRADVVVLSACQTGLGKVTEGDDIIGLNRAFLYAGTHAIISSLWRVSDLSTAIMTKQFYRQYLRHNKADSLRRAILHVKNRYPHPGYWGAFTLVGDYY